MLKTFLKNFVFWFIFGALFIGAMSLMFWLSFNLILSVWKTILTIALLTGLVGGIIFTIFDVEESK